VQSPSSTPFSPAFKRVELAAILTAGTLAAASLPTIAGVGLLNLPIALGALILADFGSGVVHWAFDRWGDVDTPLIGPNLIRTFREHHTDPAAMTRHSFVESNGGPAMAACGLLSLGLAIPGIVTSALFWLSAFVFFTNVIHGWAHKRAPAPARWLQRHGLILSPQHHGGHHTWPHDHGYCITTGWCNPVLDYFGVWDKAERVITALTGAVPAGTVRA
jgi:ubiquitin-conjugating enzyme E2 variant